MSEQTAIPVADAPPPSGPCAWSHPDNPCPPATRTITVAKARYRTVKAGGETVRVTARAAVVVPACPHHHETVEREELD